MTTVATMDPRICPDCGNTLVEHPTHQPALFYHGGYGATELTIIARCHECGWSLQRERSEVRPMMLVTEPEGPAAA